MTSILVGLAPWVLGFIGIAIIVPVAWSRIQKYGEERYRRKRAEAEAAFARRRLKTTRAADLTDDQHDDFIDSL